MAVLVVVFTVNIFKSSKQSIHAHLMSARQELSNQHTMYDNFEVLTLMVGGH